MLGSDRVEHGCVWRRRGHQSQDLGSVAGLRAHAPSRPRLDDGPDAPPDEGMIFGDEDAHTHVCPCLS